MIRIWLALAILAGLVHFVITVWRSRHGKEQLALTKSLGYSIIIALLVLTAMVAPAVLF